MYWPIGPPKAYALAKSRTTAPPLNSHDGSEASRDDAPDDAVSEVEVEEEKVNGGSGTHEGDNEILAARISRGGSVFATITRSQLTVWQTKPAVALASVVRSPQSMKAYGPSTALLLRPDGLIIVVQTALGYLITYSLSTDPNARGDMVGMIQPFLDAGIDGFFTDHPDLGVQAVDTWMQGKKEHPGRGVGKTAQRGLKVR